MAQKICLCVCVHSFNWKYEARRHGGQQNQHAIETRQKDHDRGGGEGGEKRAEGGEVKL